MINSKCVYVKLTNIFSLILILESNFGQSYGFIWGLPRWLRGKESACQWRSHRGVRFHPLVGMIPWRGKQQPAPVFFFFFNIYLFIWLCQVLVAVCGIFNWDMQTVSCGMWDLVPWLGIKPWPPALGEWSLNQRTTREVPAPGFLPGKPHGQRSLVGCSPWGPRVGRDGAHMHAWFSMTRTARAKVNQAMAGRFSFSRDERIRTGDKAVNFMRLTFCQ